MRLTTLKHLQHRWRHWRRVTRPVTYEEETGLRRRALFITAAEEELTRAGRFNRPLALITFRLDPDQPPPDRAAIQRFAAILRHQTRGFDLVGRDDDGTFLLLLPEGDAAAAATVGERLEQEARRLTLTSDRHPGTLTIALYPQHGVLIEELLVSAHTVGALKPPTPPPATASTTPTAPAASNPGAKRRLRLFIGVVAVTGGAVLAASLPTLGLSQLIVLLPLLMLVLLAERLTRLRFGETSYSLSLIACMAITAIAGPAAGALAGCLNGLVVWGIRRQPLAKGLFNIGMFILASAAAGLPYWLTGGLPALGWWPVGLLPGVVSGLIYTLVNNLLLTTVVALDKGDAWSSVWRTRFNWQVLHQSAAGVIGLGLAALYALWGPTGLILMLGPVGLIFLAQYQYISHTASHIAELSDLNQRLSTSNDQLTTSNERLAQTFEELNRAHESILTVLSEALEYRDQETEGHSQRVVYYARALASALALSEPESQVVVHGALLHDIGKIGVTDAILRKPGKLSPEEWVEMRRHPEIGYQMIIHIPFLAQAAILVRHHHERWDGQGYPSGLAETSIPIGARIFAVVDSFDAMTSDRPYRAALSWDVAIQELIRCSGSQYDPDVVIAFVRLVTSGQLVPLAATSRPLAVSQPASHSVAGS